MKKAQLKPPVPGILPTIELSDIYGDIFSNISFKAKDGTEIIIKLHSEIILGSDDMFCILPLAIISLFTLYAIVSLFHFSGFLVKTFT